MKKRNCGRLLFVICMVYLLAGCQKTTSEQKDLFLEGSTVTPCPTAIATVTIAPTHIPTATPTSTATMTPTPSPTGTPTPTPEPLDITICFAGDISLADGAVTTKQWENSGQELDKCISPELLDIMNAAEVMCINNEFTFSKRGKPLEGKAYTFRAAPERVSLLLEMGVDLALLANNHVYDYGRDSILDTFDTLTNAGIAYFGAGHTLEEAMQPYYVEIDGITIAFVAASRAEKYKMTPQATDTEPGILRCYDTELFLEVIKEADANADIVLACVHWGTEYSTKLEEVQLTTGKMYLDAGADAVIGSHSHCLQGMEFYNGKPIIYSLGNFWFNHRSLDTMLLEVHITGERDNPQIDVVVIPALQENCKTMILTGQEEKQELYEYLESISVNIEIDEFGTVREK